MIVLDPLTYALEKWGSGPEPDYSPVYISLCTEQPTPRRVIEPTRKQYHDYTRVRVPHEGWTTATDGTTENVQPIEFPAMSKGVGCALVGFCVCDKPVGGIVILCGLLTKCVFLAIGSQPRFEAGTLRIGCFRGLIA